MKSILLAIAFVLTTTGILCNIPGPRPATPDFRAITAEQIKEGYKQEVKDRVFNRAAAQAQDVFRAHHVVLRHATLVAKYALAHHIPVRLLAAVVYAESTGNASAISAHGDVGLMQINMKVWKYSRTELLNPERNLQIGSHILGALIHQYGTVEGLHHYNGMGRQDNSYAAHVFQVAGYKVPA
ncbi:MAG TPA: transglycosylase SLT domain-containing protein [Candidatus Acidoferrum sp.]|nr:transglycosylase SLT domain-containing protein [Candidatus Acidoferrum sp.]